MIRALSLCTILLVLSCSGGASEPDASFADAGSTDSARPDSGPVIPHPNYPLLFDETQIHNVHLELTPEDWTALNDTWTSYVPATFHYDDQTVENVGVRFKGNVSLDFGGNKKSFKIKFSEYRSSHRFHGLKRMNLHNGFKDPTIMRENLAYPLVRTAGAPASRTSHINLYITVPGVHAREFWGLYINTEQVDRTFLRDRFENPEGTLYKGGDFYWRGEQVEEYVPEIYQPKTNETGDHTPLVRFLDVLNNTPSAKFEEEIIKVFDVDSFLAWLAANTLLSNMDNIANGGGGNCYLYYNPVQDKFSYIGWDNNEAFGSTSEGLSIDELLTLDVHAPVNEPRAPNPLIGRILEVPLFRERYLNRVESLVQGAFSESEMGRRIDALYALSSPFARMDTRKQYSVDQYERSFDEDVPGLPNPPYPTGNMVIGLRRFIEERGVHVRSQLGL